MAMLVYQRVSISPVKRLELYSCHGPWRIFKKHENSKFPASGLGYDYHLLCRKYFPSQIQSHRLQKDQTSKYQPPNVLANLPNTNLQTPTIQGQDLSNSRMVPFRPK